MHSTLSFSRPHRSAALGLRAQLSPLVRLARRTLGERSRPALAPLRNGWNPQLLDQLRAPLTRFHD